ncbi:cytochrome b/b6 domain-containing protein [Pseudochelatococcus contaminans]|uniref:Cytochrome b561 n=1 Tax=Pseudochelatococcus contaminans TaxID=1538103 RepID=A0A7W6EGV2_9HYPH|nr:cytochrome b/b6 domain-containing protein [Pseudochelatococcus contaminans]MBB3809645.1 cytochrome b561 [Pseudochelatococcus contaminans]
MTTERSTTRYTGIAIALHWTIAFLVIAMAAMGWWMVDAITDPSTQQAAYRVFQLHKSIGFAILALTAIRIVWRLTHPAPPLPPGMKWWEVFLAKATHIGFYGLLIAIPLTGWAYVSAGWAVSTDRPLNVATSWFGLFQVPHLPGFEGDRNAAYGAMGAHSLLVWAGVVLVALHAGAALKHQFIDRDGVLGQMVPFLRRDNDEHSGHIGKTSASSYPSMFAAVAGVLAVVAVALTGWSWSQPGPLAIAATPVAETAITVTEVAAQPSATSDAATEATATAWVIDKAASSIVFSGTHAGSPFEGRFNEWTGDIRFDPDDLSGSKAVVIIDTASARTGDATQENSIGTGEWFNSARFPQARFETSTFAALGEDRYEAKGTLTIKDKPFPVTLPFRLIIDNGVANVEGTVELDRTELDLGMFSDPAAEWVSQMIDVKIVVRAAAN